MKFFTPNQLKHGLMMCFVTAICLLLMEVTGQNQSFDTKSPFVIVFMFIAPAVIWYLGIIKKKQILKNKITFKRAFIEGVRISLVYAVFSPFVFLGYYMINPGILNYVSAAYGMTGAPDHLVILMDMFVQFISASIFGSVYAAIISFFVVKVQK